MLAHDARVKAVELYLAVGWIERVLTIASKGQARRGGSRW